MTAPTAPELATSAFPRAGGRWRTQVGVPVMFAGLILVVASAFLPWVEVYKQIGESWTDVTYFPWDLPIRALFPLYVWFPLPFVVRAALRARAGRPRIGLRALLALCALGALGAGIFAVQGTLNVDPIDFFGHAYSRDTILVGCLCSLVGFGVLVLGTLVLGRAPARPDETEAPSS